MNLSAIDMNLVIALDALIRERNVTHAAKRVGLSQPAMSHALMRLRDALGDPLLVRAGRQMVLTPRAEALANQVACIVHELGALFGGASPPFDPATSARAFRVAATQYAQLVFVSELGRDVAREAPEVSLVVLPLDDEAAAIERLRTGELDLALGVFSGDDLPSDIRQAEMLLDRFVGLTRPSHPTARGRVSLEIFAGLSHVVVAGGCPRDGVIDDLITQRGIARRVVMTLPYVFLAPPIVAGSDLVVTVAERIARAFGTMLALRIFHLPFQTPAVKITMLWHRRLGDDPACAWLRRFAKDTARRMRQVRRHIPRTTMAVGRRRPIKRGSA